MNIILEGGRERQQGNKPKKSHPKQTYALLCVFHVVNNPLGSTANHWWSCSHVPKTPSSPLTEEVSVRAASKPPPTKHAGSWCSHFYSWLCHQFTSTLAKWAKRCHSSQHSFRGLGRISVQEFWWAQALGNRDQKKGQQQHCHVHHFWLQRARVH